jgi:hypothetical protein
MLSNAWKFSFSSQRWITPKTESFRPLAKKLKKKGVSTTRARNVQPNCTNSDFKIRVMRGWFQVSLLPAVGTDAEKVDFMPLDNKSGRNGVLIIKSATGYFE